MQVSVALSLCGWYNSLCCSLPVVTCVLSYLSDKWTDPLMGWDSASNEIEQTALHLRAATKEEAVRIAVRNGAPFPCTLSYKPWGVRSLGLFVDGPGWVYEVMPAPDDRPHEFKTYAYNFLPEVRGLFADNACCVGFWRTHSVTGRPGKAEDHAAKTVQGPVQAFGPE
jgi:hypothetical protein